MCYILKVYFISGSKQIYQSKNHGPPAASQKTFITKVYIQYALLHRLYTNSQLSFFNYWINCNVQQKFLCDPNYVLYVLQGLAGIAGAPGEPGRTGESGIPGPSGEPGEAGERVCIF